MVISTEIIHSVMLPLLIAFAVSAALCPIVIPFLHKLKFGQQVREDGPQAHLKKQGTPTMGGLIILSSIVITSLFYMKDYPRIIPVLFMTVGFGIIGFLDDYEKLRKKQNLGLSAKSKFLLQLVAALAFVFLMRRTGYVTTNLYIPFWNVVKPLPEAVYFIFAAFVIVGTVNSVNLTDGVDGLAAGTSIPVCLFFAVLTYVWGTEFLALGIFASAIAGGLLGFLVYNFNPAKVFMGDTGSLFLGGAIAAMVFAYDMPLILIVLGLMYIIETLSDIIQVTYFKLSHGKRIFKMAPFHHHLEMGGWTGKKWTERELFVLYFSISLICAVISFVGVYNRYAF